MTISNTNSEGTGGVPAGADAAQVKSNDAKPEESITSMMEKVRQEEKKKLYSQIEREKQSNHDLRTRTAALEQELQEQKLAKLPPDEAYKERLAQLEAQNRRLTDEANTARIQAEQRARAAQVLAYRERAIRGARDNGRGIVLEMVVGSSEEEIDRAIELSAAEYRRIEDRIREQLAAEMAQRHQQQFVPTQYAPQPPQNPAYVPQQQFQPGAGMPQVVNPAPVTEQGPPTAPDISALTNEHAIRSGIYGGETRAHLLAQIQRMGNPQSTTVGNFPRSWSPAQQVQQPMPYMQQQQLPGGAVQPHGNPIAAPQHPRMVQQPMQPWPAQAPQHPSYPQQPQQYPQQVPQPQYPQYPQYPQQMPPQQPQQPAGAPMVDPARMAAQEAINRTLQGNNPVMGDNPGAAQALQEAHQYGQYHGVTPNTAHAQRFAASPPIPVGPPGSQQ